MPSTVLHQTLEDAARRAPGRLAVEEGEDPPSDINRRGLSACSNRGWNRMGLIGMGPGELISLSDPLFGFAGTLAARR